MSISLIIFGSNNSKKIKNENKITFQLHFKTASKQ